jgi:YkoY family integral membrane protein
MQDIQHLFEQIIAKPVPSLVIIFNLILIESLLSVDNAAVLATMVMHLPKDQRSKALKIGLIWAYIFRGLCLLFAYMLIQIWWFKPLGGLYLLILAAKHFLTKKKHEDPETIAEELEKAERGWLYRNTIGKLGTFWSTVIMVEVMDLAFSIDNVIAANAYTNNIILIWLGVFIGILAMRFVAQKFVKLLERYPFLEACAFTVIALLGVKLTISVVGHYYPCSAITAFMEGSLPCLESRGEHIPYGEHPLIWGDILTSIVSIAIFILPVLSSVIFNFPKHKDNKEG